MTRIEKYRVKCSVCAKDFGTHSLRRTVCSDACAKQDTYRRLLRSQMMESSTELSIARSLLAVPEVDHDRQLDVVTHVQRRYGALAAACELDSESWWRWFKFGESHPDGERVPSVSDIKNEIGQQNLF